MVEWRKSFNEWVHLPLIQHNTRHVSATLSTIIAFVVLILVVDKVMPEEYKWLRPFFHNIEVAIVLYTFGLLALELLVRYTREVCRNLKENHNEA